MENLYVFNPDTRKFVPAEEWLNDPDPKRAQLVGILTPYYLLVMAKNPVGEFNFEKAQEAAKAFKVDGFDHEFRCPRRNEFNYIYDARFEGLDDLMEKIDGSSHLGYRWTCEKDLWSSSLNIANFAWLSNGTYGYAYYINMYIAYLAVPVTLLDVGEAAS